MMLVSLEEARAHIRSDTNDDEADLTLKIKGASAAVMTYIKVASWADSSGLVPVDSSGVAYDTPDDIKSACLLLIGEFYKNREGEQSQPVDGQYGYGFLSRAVLALLYPYRVPTVSMSGGARTDGDWWYRRNRCC